ncbi:MAG: peptide deformylase [Thermoleophilia bacterium]|nr:peptide deformylase [Thermoleophilia bacterium]
MAVRDVVIYPDARLKTVCASREAASLSRDRVAGIANDLLDTMRSFPGCVGIAAPQIGELVRMVAIDVTGAKRAVSCHGELVLVDPILVALTGSVTMREGCLSIPDFTGNVRRAERVTVRATTADGTPVELECDAYEARVLLHELDHLDGLLFLDRVSSAREIFPRKRYQ